MSITAFLKRIFLPKPQLFELKPDGNKDAWCLFCPYTNAWPPAPFSGEGRHWEKFMQGRASKRLRCPTVKYLISWCTKEGFLQYQRKGYFLPALAEFNLVPATNGWWLLLLWKFRMTSTTLAPGKSVSDCMKLKLVLPQPHSGGLWNQVWCQHRLCWFPTTVRDAVDSRQAMSLGWSRK